MGRGLRFGEILRPGQPRYLDVAVGAANQRQTGAALDQAIPASRNDDRRDSESASGGNSTGWPAYSSYTIDTFSLSITLSSRTILFISLVASMPITVGRSLHQRRRRLVLSSIKRSFIMGKKQTVAPSLDGSSGVGLSPRPRRTPGQSLRTRPADHHNANPKNPRGGKRS